MARKSPSTRSTRSTAKSMASSSERGGRRKRERAVEQAPSERAEELEQHLKTVLAISEVMADAVGFEGLIERVVPLISKSLHAARSTLFLLDTDTGGLWSMVAEGETRRTIRLSPGQGLAGWVAAHQEPLRVDDAYEDDRFNPEVDAKTGFRTHSVAAVPVRNGKRDLLGVIQVLNKQDGPFVEDDLRLLDAIATQTAYAIENAQLAEELLEQNRRLERSRRRSEHRRAELDLLYQLEQESAGYDEIEEMLDTMIVRVCERMKSEAGSVVLSGNDSSRLFFRGVSGSEPSALRETAITRGAGIVGWVAEHGEPVLVNAPEDDPRHDVSLAAEIETEAILAVPLVWDRRIIGAVEVVNPDGAGDDGGYTLEDLKVLTVIAGQIARAVSLVLERQVKGQTERLAVMGRMLAGVAHDLRTPMTVISGYAQLMAIDPIDASRMDRCERILRQVDEMTAMIGDLLSFARGETTLKVGEVTIAALANEVGEHLREHCDSREIRFVLETEGDFAYVDPGRARRIVYNLARNAMDVMAPSDTLTVRLAGRDHGLSIEVEDTGPGIPESIRNTLFEPFVSAGKANGTGLGLSIVRRFVDDHHGTIRVDSSLGRGSRFEVFLPPAQLDTQRHRRRSHE